MKLEYKKGLVFILAGAVYLSGQFFRGVWFNPSWPFPCQEIRYENVVYCHAPYMSTLGWPLINLGIMLALVAVLLLWTSADTFRNWLRFSAVYIPIVIALDLLIFPVSLGSGLFMGGGTLGYEQGAYPFGRLFVFATLLIVLRGLYHTKKVKA